MNEIASDVLVPMMVFGGCLLTGAATIHIVELVVEWWKIRKDRARSQGAD